MVRKKFQACQEIVLYKSRWKSLIGKWKSRFYGPFLVNEVFAGGAVQVIDHGYECTFVMKGQKLRYEGRKNASEKVPSMLTEP